MQCFNSLIFMCFLTVLLTAGGLAVAKEQPPNEAPAALTARPAPDQAERAPANAPIEAATTVRPAMTEQELSTMIEGEVLMSLSMRLASSAPQS